MPDIIFSYDESNRLIYSSDENQNLRILSCKGHYI